MDQSYTNSDLVTGLFLPPPEKSFIALLKICRVASYGLVENATITMMTKKQSNFLLSINKFKTFEGDCYARF